MLPSMPAPEPLPLPRHLVAAAEQEGRTAWLVTLPATVAHLAGTWSLTVGPPFQPGGQTAWVAPVRDRAGSDLVLKVAWSHPEARDEAEGLRAWAGNGAVRLHAVERLPHTTALLLESCRPGTPLTALPERRQDVVIAVLLRRLWSAPVTAFPFRPLQAMCDLWADEFTARVRAAPALTDPGLAGEGIALFRALPVDSDRRVLLTTDLHAGNVLAAEREPWLLIDRKPYVGDPTYDPLQHLLNCQERLRADPAGLAGRIAELCGLDPARLRRWLYARCLQESLDEPALADIARRIPLD
jgi:streptomycin 6-kinase